MKGKLKFEGIYYNDKEWEGKGYDEKNNYIYKLKRGKGLKKEYYDNGKLKFEGVYINGERNDKGKEYDENGNLIYEGEYINGKRNGKGKEYYKDGNLKFEGEYLYDFKLKGKEYSNNILEYEGEYSFNKKWNGKVYDKYGNVIYELYNGKGKIQVYNIFDLGERYEKRFGGDYLNREMNGKEIENWNGEMIFEDEFLNEEM